MKLTNEDRTLHQQFSEYGRNAKEWTRKCALLLPGIDHRQIWKKRKCSSIYEYAAKVAGMSRYAVNEALRILEKVEDKPLLKALIEEVGINKVKPVISIVTEETEAFWVQKARELPKNALETYVRNYRSDGLPRKSSEPEKYTDEINVEFTVKTALAKKLEQIKKRADFEVLLEKFVESVERQDETERPESVGNSSRHIPVEIQKYVENKTGGLCAYPGCSKPATSLHHTQRWALEKVHDPARLQPLCTAHERLAHKGLIENEEASPENWKLRTQSDKTNSKFYIDTLIGLYRRHG